MGCPLKQGGGLYERLSITAVLLAAGRGQRMGERPKPLLELGGVPLIRRLLVALSSAGVDQVVVVTGGPHEAAIEAAIADFPLTLAHTGQTQGRQVDSVRAGLRHVPATADAVMMVLCDQPLLNGDDLGALIRAYKQRGPAQVVVPRVDGRRGNPVILAAALCDGILAGGEDVGVRQWMEAHLEAVHFFDSDNRHFVEDVDTDADLDAFARRYGHALKWPQHLSTA